MLDIRGKAGTKRKTETILAITRESVLTSTSHNEPLAARDAAPAPLRRDAAATRERILDAGCAEFSQHGYNGARMDRIAKRSRANIRMLYHYFGGKEKLYLAVLEDTYRRVRERELQLDLNHAEPATGMRGLIEFTFDYMIENPAFVRLICNENLLNGGYLKKSRIVPETTLPLVDALTDLLRRGQIGGVFHKNIGPVQLYVTILSVCFTHVSNRYTLSTMFQRDLADRRWLAERRKHVVDVVLTYLTADIRSPVARKGRKGKGI